MGISIIRTEWSGTTGGPGLSQMCIEGFIPVPAATAEDWCDAVRAFWFSLASLLPNELTLNVAPTVDSFDTETGDLDSTVVIASPPAQVAGASISTYAGGSGVKVKWDTNQIKFGKRVRGSTFIVPIASNAFTATGVVSGAAQTTINNAAATLVTAIDNFGGNLAVWSRPRTEPTAREGFATHVVQGLCSTKSAILRSRRD